MASRASTRRQPAVRIHPDERLARRSTRLSSGRFRPLAAWSWSCQCWDWPGSVVLDMSCGKLRWSFRPCRSASREVIARASRRIGHAEAYAPHLIPPARRSRGSCSGVSSRRPRTIERYSRPRRSHRKRASRESTCDVHDQEAASLMFSTPPRLLHRRQRQSDRCASRQLWQIRARQAGSSFSDLADRSSGSYRRSASQLHTDPRKASNRDAYSRNTLHLCATRRSSIYTDEHFTSNNFRNPF